MSIFRNFGRQQMSPIEQRMQTLQTQGPQIADFLNQLNAMSPQGPQAQAAPMALQAAQTLQQGMAPAQMAQASQNIARQLNSALGQVAGGGATGASFQAQAGTGALPGFAQALGNLQAQNAQMQRQGTESVFSQLANTLTQADPQQEAFGRLLAQANSAPRFGMQTIGRRLYAGVGGFAPPSSY